MGFFCGRYTQQEHGKVGVQPSIGYVYLNRRSIIVIFPEGWLLSLQRGGLSSTNNCFSVMK